MKRLQPLITPIMLGLGVVTSAALMAAMVIWARFRPLMIAFAPLSNQDLNLLNWAGVSLVLLLVFYLLSLWRLVAHLRWVEKLSLLPLLLIGGGVLSLLAVFSDVALLSDIGKQYELGLAQPEWRILRPITVWQLIMVILLTGWQAVRIKTDRPTRQVVRDNHVFLITQYVGTLCGSLGLGLSSLGFVFTRAWSLSTHVVLSSIILFMPYLLIVGYRLVIRLSERPRILYSQRQLQNVGKSAFLTLVLSVVVMISLFVANYHQLAGVISLIWLPLYLFLVLFLFSAGNLYFTSRQERN